MKYTIEVIKVMTYTKTLTVEGRNEQEARDCAKFEALDKNFDDAPVQTTEYKVGEVKKIENQYIDKYGNPYDSEDDNACWPAGGGLHKDCEFNADALYAYYTLGDRYKIAKYLRSKGFKETLHGDHEEVWVKGNTEVTYEDYDNWGHLWGYMHTELIEG